MGGIHTIKGCKVTDIYDLSGRLKHSWTYGVYELPKGYLLIRDQQGHVKKYVITVL